jgi:hypothetical protein
MEPGVAIIIEGGLREAMGGRVWIQDLCGGAGYYIIPIAIE